MQHEEQSNLIPRLNRDKSDIPSLRKSVNACLENYFAYLEGHAPSEVYKLVVEEVELSLLTFVMKKVKGNQCKAAQWLGIHRGTLRKKLKQYQLLENVGKRKAFAIEGSKN